MPIVQATFVSAYVRGNRALSKRLEAAMAFAIATARDEGITDSAAIKERMMTAYHAEKGRP